MNFRMPTLAVTTWLALVIGCVAPVCAALVVVVAHWLDRDAFEQNVRANLHATAFAVESSVTVYVLTGQGGRSSVDALRRVVQPHSLSVYGQDGALMVRDETFECVQPGIQLTGPIVVDQMPFQCVWVPIVLGRSGSVDEIYEEAYFGGTIAQETVESDIERVGLVGLAFQNTGWVRDKLLLAEMVIILITLGLCIYGMKRIVGRRFTTITDCIRGRRYAELQRLVESDRLPVSELHMISEAYLEQERGARDLKTGLLRADEHEEEVALEMAAEIHDHLCARLNLLKREIETSVQPGADTTRNSDPARWIELIDQIDSSARRIIKRSANDVTDMLGIEAGLRELVGHFNDRRITFAYRVDSDVPATLHRPISRVIHEAITNALKHAKCTAIRVSVVEAEAGQIVVSIRDDGVGLDAASKNAASMGMVLMRERANRVGADLRIDSSQSGTTVRMVCQLPS